MKNTRTTTWVFILTMVCLGGNCHGAPATVVETGTERILATGTAGEDWWRWKPASMDVTNDGDLVILGGSDDDDHGIVYAWSLLNNRLAWTADLGFIGRNGYTPVLVQFSPNEDVVLVCGPEHGLLLLLDGDTGERKCEMRSTDWWVFAATFRPGGQEIATLARDVTILDGAYAVAIFEVATGELQCTIELQDFPDDDDLISVAFSEDGEKMVPRFSTFQTAARVWDVPSGRLVQSFAHGSHFISGSLSADGALAATGDAEGLSVWSVEDGALSRHFPGAWPATDFSFCEFSNNGSTLLAFQTSGDPNFASGGIDVWDLQNDGYLGYLDSGGRGTQAAKFFQSDTRALVLAQDVLTVWDTASRERLSVLDLQALGTAVLPPCTSPLVVTEPTQVLGTGITYDLLMLPHEEQLLTVGSRGAFLWDIAEGKLQGHFKIDIAEHALLCGVTSADGRLLVTGGLDGVVRVWDVAAASEIRSFQAFSPSGDRDDRFWSVDVSTDARRILTHSGDYDEGDARVALWNGETGELLRDIGSLGENGNAHDVAFSKDGTLVVTSHEWPDNTVRLWNASTGALMKSFSPVNNVVWVAISPGGSLVAGGDWGNILVWDTESGDLVHTFPWQGGTESSFPVPAFSPDGTFILGHEGFDSPTVRMWNVTTAEVAGAFGGHRRGVHMASFSDDSKRLYTVDVQNTLRVWSTETGEILSTFTYPDHGAAALFSPDGKEVLAGGALWDWRTGTLDVILGAQIGDAAFSPDSRRLATSRGLIHETDSGAVVSQVTSDSSIGALCFSPDGTQLITGNSNNLIEFWNAETGELLRTLQGHRGDVHSLDFSCDGSLLLSAGGGDNEQVPPEVYLWDLEERAIVRSFEGIVGRSVLDAEFSPDGRTVVTASMWKSYDQAPGSVQLWDALTGALLRTFETVDGPTGTIRSVAFSPDGRWLLSGGTAATLRDAATGQVLRTLCVGEDIRSVAFSPDGHHALTGSGGSAALWDIRDLLAKPRFVQSPNGFEIQWELGILQFAHDVTGPWIDVPATSPMPLSPIAGRGFFRVKVHEPDVQPIANMVWIPPGTFMMGSPEDEQDRLELEGPQTQVTLTQGFWMGKYEVTQGEYETVMGENPSPDPRDPHFPVDGLFLSEAWSYCDALTQSERAAGRLPIDYAYRPPTEAEWEYACRAGTTTRFGYGDDPDYTDITDHAWYRENSGGTLHPVGRKRPNAWGLYDMHGNVHEWCSDKFAPYLGGMQVDPQGPPEPGGGRVVRSGSANATADRCRTASRLNGRDFTAGFRVVLARERPWESER